MINKQNIAKIKQDAGQALIVAATKSRGIEQIKAIKQQGLCIVGENRVQELLAKYEVIDGLKWHFIGNLQTNKVRYIVDKVAMIQSVDRQNLAIEIDKQCQKIGVIMPVLIEVNIGEEAKGGVSIEGLAELLDFVKQQNNLALKGLMFIPPIDAKEETYKQIKEIFDKHKDKFGLEYLSCGMSGDYEMALEHGANMIRPGTILFE